MPEVQPLVPPDVDLRGLDYMPLFGNHLFGSEFNAAASDSEWRAAITLWWAAWNQVPAGSLPDDDAALCRLADLGRDVKTWKKLRERALHGFTRCTDGRLYHEFLCQQAVIAWDKRVKERQRKAKWRADQDAKKRSVDADVPGTNNGTEEGTSASWDATVRADGTGMDGNGRDGIKEDRGINTSGTTYPHPPAIRLNGSHSAGLPGIEAKKPTPEKLPDCPHSALVGLYAKHLPQLRQPKVWAGGRVEAMRARWRQGAAPSAFGSGYVDVDGGLRFWDKFFAFVATCPKLTKGIQRQDQSRWEPDLPWLMKAENFAKVIEGNYAP